MRVYHTVDDIVDPVADIDQLKAEAEEARS